MLKMFILFPRDRFVKEKVENFSNKRIEVIYEAELDIAFNVGKYRFYPWVILRCS
jgi:hypothetical protein